MNESFDLLNFLIINKILKIQRKIEKENKMLYLN
jgi:hypothetical protein